MSTKSFIRVGDYLFNVSDIRNMYINRDAIRFDFRNPKAPNDWISISYPSNKAAKAEFEKIVEEIMKKA